ncbi:MAG: rhodanese-like domain-containing protein [Campylobacterota bacterium]|nr:rhodanese-like domain-containing protein [Campylobacterota bacterium]
MRQILLILLLVTSIFAEVINQKIDKKLIDSGIKIIDIRTPSEWRETGVVKGSIPIMFFDERGQYNLNEFMSKLNKHVKKGEKFALICRSGSRTTMVSQFLSKEYGYDVINLEGGILYGIGAKVPLIPYQ